MSKKVRSFLRQAIGGLALVGGYVVIAVIGELICKLFGVGA